MAGPPKCKVCGYPHWLHEPHRWDGVTPAVSGVEIRKATELVRPIEAKVLPDDGVLARPDGVDDAAFIEALLDRIEELEALVAVAEKRKAYQRELMAKRRAEKKA